MRGNWRENEIEYWGKEITRCILMFTVRFKWNRTMSNGKLSNKQTQNKKKNQNSFEKKKHSSIQIKCVDVQTVGERSISCVRDDSRATMTFGLD